MSSFYRVQLRSYDLTEESVSWPWGLSREQAEEEGLLLDGVSCCDSATALYDYFQARGGADDELCYVIHFEGRYVGHDGEADVAQFEREIARLAWSDFAAKVERGELE